MSDNSGVQVTGGGGNRPTDSRANYSTIHHLEETLFETIPNFELKTPLSSIEFGGVPGTSYWRVFRRVFNEPNFLLSVVFGDEDTYSFYISDFADVVGVLASPEIYRHDLFIIIPSHLNSSGLPSLSRVESVKRLKFGEQNVEQYVLDDGRTVSSSSIFPDCNHITEEEILYSART